MKFTVPMILISFAMSDSAIAQPSAVRTVPNAIRPVTLVHAPQQQHMRARGVVISVDARRHKLEIKHDGIADLGLPPGITPFSAVIAVSLKNIHPGMEVDIEFTVGKSDNSQLHIHSIAPAPRSEK